MALKVIACYPRTMSAWLSNLLNVPHVALYAHDILNFPDMVEVIEGTDYPYKGIVDTGATPDNLPDCELTVIDADKTMVEARCKKLFGDVDLTPLYNNMEALKEIGTVYHFDEMEGWLPELFQHHTGLPFDWGRYRMLRNLNVQSQFARALQE